MQILYLYSELVGYQIPILLEYVKSYNAQVHVVSWDKNKLKPYEPPIHDGITYYKRSEFDIKKLNELADSINPDIIYVSGWMDKGYLNVTKRFRKLGIPVLTGFDDIWEGHLRQRLGALLFPFVFKKYFSHAWVAGPAQFEFASRLGFKRDEIIMNTLSANTSLFTQDQKSANEKSKNFPKNFLYVGNFRSVKGTDILAEAYKTYREEFSGDWDLICVGNGEMQKQLEGIPGIRIIKFSGQEKLIELTKECGVFVLPSRHEQWALVAHEFAAAGMPLLLSEAVGARHRFLIEGFNGMSFPPDSSQKLAYVFDRISQFSTHKLIQMGHNSTKLAKSISPELSAASFLSPLFKREFYE